MLVVNTFSARRVSQETLKSVDLFIYDEPVVQWILTLTIKPVVAVRFPFTTNT